MSGSAIAGVTVREALASMSVSPRSPRGYHEVDLETLLISEVIDFLPAAAVDLVLDDLRRHEAFEERTEKRRPAQFRLGIDVEQMAGESRVERGTASAI